MKSKAAAICYALACLLMLGVLVSQSIRVLPIVETTETVDPSRAIDGVVTSKRSVFRGNRSSGVLGQKNEEFTGWYIQLEGSDEEIAVTEAEYTTADPGQRFVRK
jgi:hypothetical protein